MYSTASVRLVRSAVAIERMSSGSMTSSGIDISRASAAADVRAYWLSVKNNAGRGGAI